DDHATGDSAGSVVPSRANVPASRKRAKLGSNPESIHFSVNAGSWPSRPTITTRRARLTPGRFGGKTSLSTQRKGHVRSTTKAEATAANRTKNVETMVNPAPGPR